MCRTTHVTEFPVVTARKTDLRGTKTRHGGSGETIATSPLKSQVERQDPVSGPPLDLQVPCLLRLTKNRHRSKEEKGG